MTALEIRINQFAKGLASYEPENKTCDIAKQELIRSITSCLMLFDELEEYDPEELVIDKKIKIMVNYAPEDEALVITDTERG